MTPYKRSKPCGRIRRKIRIRKKIFGTISRPRFTVFRSAKHIYVQLIDDEQSNTLLSASTLTEKLDVEKITKIQKAKAIGLSVAKLCKEKNIDQVVFDRNGYLFHGRVKAIADGAIEGGLKI